MSPHYCGQWKGIRLVVNALKKFIVLTFLLLVASVSLAQDDLVFPIQQGTVSDWKYVSDQVMGGFLRGRCSWRKMEIPHLQGSLVM